MKYAILLGMTLGLAGCGTTYFYGGKTYGSEADVYTAQEDVLGRALGDIDPIATPLPLRARVAGPNRQTLFKGNPDPAKRILYFLDSIQVYAEKP